MHDCTAAILNLMRARHTWTGTAAALCQALAASNCWIIPPPARLGRVLRSIENELKGQGISIEFQRTATTRVLTIRNGRPDPREVEERQRQAELIRMEALPPAIRPGAGERLKQARGSRW